MSMKVLIVSDAWHPQVNGVVRTYECLIDELTETGIATKVIGPADFPYTMAMPFYPEIRLVLSPYARLKSLIENFNPDKIHIATEGPLGWAARYYCQKTKRTFTTSYHTQFPDYVAKRFAWLFPPLYNAVHRFCICWVRHFHAPSQALFIATSSLEHQLKSWGFKTPMVQMTRGVNTDIFFPGTQEISEQYTKPVALYVGRIAIEKNLEAFLNMPWPGSKVLVGDGPVLSQLKDRYPDAHFAGKKTGHDLAAYYRASDVFVFPSKTDTFGIVLIEALACGIPVAAYNVMGPKDIVTEPYMGVLTDHDLSAAALKSLECADSKKCAAYITEKYSWKTAGKQFLSGL